MTRIDVGSPAPDFTISTDTGESLTLAACRGHKLVLYFYPKAGTQGCTIEAHDFDRLGPQFAAADTRVIGISPDSDRAIGRFRSKQALSLALAGDEAHAVLEAYGVWTEKSMYGRKFMGVERTTVLIDREGRIARLWPKVKVAGHADEVLEAAKAL
ncbi:peroxiredoxin [Ancylobacter mangrovi]|uniref:peroxiredoxin n=1 Tax=Ancylobacter mangrovi TaxID=2972472 RepID=UPI002161EE03|nr:peroxiredoxin [Ancylobacter mangrovi]MCS0501807.1 peroxiredoxin [Ancylobacter mangrovi]